MTSALLNRSKSCNNISSNSIWSSINSTNTTKSVMKQRLDKHSWPFTRILIAINKLECMTCRKLSISSSNDFINGNTKKRHLKIAYNADVFIDWKINIYDENKCVAKFTLLQKLLAFVFSVGYFTFSCLSVTRCTYIYRLKYSLSNKMRSTIDKPLMCPCAWKRQKFSKKWLSSYHLMN